jgi:hypothetical protein
MTLGTSGSVDYDMSYTRLNQSHNASNAIDDRPALHFGKTQSPTSLYVDSGEGVYLV